MNQAGRNLRSKKNTTATVRIETAKAILTLGYRIEGVR
jgi:hypothetical protein